MDKRNALMTELPHLMRYSRALTRDADAADDLLQDCVSRALSKLHLFKQGTNMRAWAFTVMHNIHAQNMRRLGRRMDKTSLEPEMEERHGTDASQMDTMALRDLDRALGRLTDDQRAVVLLVGLEDMSYAETAEILEIPVGTVMSRLARGRERLKKIMDGQEPMLRSVQ